MISITLQLLIMTLLTMLLLLLIICAITTTNTSTNTTTNNNNSDNNTHNNIVDDDSNNNSLTNNNIQFYTEKFPPNARGTRISARPYILGVSLKNKLVNFQISNKLPHQNNTSYHNNRGTMVHLAKFYHIHMQFRYKYVYRTVVDVQNSSPTQQHRFV
jgi:hypothetical protein